MAKLCQAAMKAALHLTCNDNVTVGVEASNLPRIFGID